MYWWADRAATAGNQVMLNGQHRIPETAEPGRCTLRTEHAACTGNENLCRHDRRSITENRSRDDTNGLPFPRHLLLVPLPVSSSRQACAALLRPVSLHLYSNCFGLVKRPRIASGSPSRRVSPLTGPFSQAPRFVAHHWHWLSDASRQIAAVLSVLRLGAFGTDAYTPCTAWLGGDLAFGLHEPMTLAFSTLLPDLPMLSGTRSARCSPPGGCHRRRSGRCRSRRRLCTCSANWRSTAEAPVCSPGSLPPWHSIGRVGFSK